MIKCRECSCSCNCENGGECKFQSQNEDFLIKLYFDIEKNMQDTDYHILESKLIDLPGIKGVKRDEDTLVVFYDDMLIAPEVIEDSLIK